MSDYTIEDFREMKADAGLKHLPTATTMAAREAMGGNGHLAYEWSDKPHRLIYDLCAEIEKATADFASVTLERDQLRAKLAEYEGRPCVNCGRVLPASHDRRVPAPDCPSPDACTIDMTLQEAFEHWRRIAHEQRSKLAEEREACAKLCEDMQRAKTDSLTGQWITMGGDQITGMKFATAIRSRGETVTPPALPQATEAEREEAHRTMPWES